LDYMSRAISLARKVLGTTSPNPAVGAVIVRDGVIVGEGCTQPPGSYHAEIGALHKAGERAKGASLYVSLEPCCHWGRTPPCTRAIIAAGIAEVHMAMLDPNPLVDGKGKEELEKSGVKTFLGEEGEQASETNEAYAKYVSTGLPFVTAKFAMSLDGKIATRNGDSKWITNETSRRLARRFRREADAVLVGVDTVLADDPLLTARDARGNPFPKQPLRVVLDSRGRIPADAALLSQPGNTLLVVREGLDGKTLERLAALNAEILAVPFKGPLLDLESLLKTLGQRQIVSLLVEGGGTVLGSFFDQRLVDKVVAFVSPVIIGGKDARTAVGGLGAKSMAESLRLTKTRIQLAKGDIIITGYV